MQNFSTKIKIDYNRPIFLAAAATSTRLTHLQSLLRKLTGHWTYCARFSTKIFTWQWWYIFWCYKQEISYTSHIALNVHGHMVHTPHTYKWPEHFNLLVLMWFLSTFDILSNKLSWWASFWHDSPKYCKMMPYKMKWRKKSTR